MAERRMIAKSIFMSDNFISLTHSAQALYTLMIVTADDDGFCDGVRLLIRISNVKEEDLLLLIAKKLLIQFPKDVYVITHWRMHNHVPKDRYKPTKYRKAFSQLQIDACGVYEKRGHNVSDMYTDCIQTDDKATSQVRLNKVKSEKVRGGESASARESGARTENAASAASPPCAASAASPTPEKQKLIFGKYENVLLTQEEYNTLVESGLDGYIDKLSAYIKSLGKRYTDHFVTILRWAESDYISKTAAQKGGSDSFDADDFFQSALERSLREDDD